MSASKLTTGPPRSAVPTSERGLPAPFGTFPARRSGERLSKLTVTLVRHPMSSVLTARGALDAYTVPTFRRAMERCDVTRTDVVVELTGVALIDSAGLEALRTLNRRARASGHQARFVSNRPEAASPLGFVGLTSEIAHPVSGSSREGTSE